MIFIYWTIVLLVIIGVIFLMGKSDYFKKGDWNAICDRCGEKFKASELRETWDGLKVCSKDWEARHPQDMIKGVDDDQSVPWSRPDDTEGTSVYLSLVTAIETVGVDDGRVFILEGGWTQSKSVRLSNTSAKEEDVITIYRLDESTYILRVYDDNSGVILYGITEPTNKVKHSVSFIFRNGKWETHQITTLGL